jgi:hypothetical protein
MVSICVEVLRRRRQSCYAMRTSPNGLNLRSCDAQFESGPSWVFKRLSSAFPCEFRNNSSKHHEHLLTHHNLPPLLITFRSFPEVRIYEVEGLDEFSLIESKWLHKPETSPKQPVMSGNYTSQTEGLGGGMCCAVYVSCRTRRSCKFLR